MKKEFLMGLLIIVTFLPFMFGSMKSGNSDAPVKGEDLVGSAHFETTDLGNDEVCLDRMSYDADQTELEIPAEIQGKKVAVLGREALRAEIVLADKKNGLAQVRHSSLEKVVLPAGLRKIEGNPFKECPGLKEIGIDEENSVFAVQDGMLINQAEHVLISLLPTVEGEVTVPSDILRIGEAAFFRCKISGVTLPEGLKEIGDQAFGYCEELHEVMIPESVTTFGEEPFYCVGIPLASSAGTYSLLKQGLGKDSYPFKLRVIAGSAGEEYAANSFFPYEAVSRQDQP